MKKILALILGLVMVFGLVACGDSQPTGVTTENETEPSSVTETENVVEKEEGKIAIEYVGWKLNSAVSDVVIPEDAAAAFDAACEKENIKLTPVAYIASKEGDTPAYQFLCVGEGGMPAIDYEGYDVQLENVKLFTVIVAGSGADAYIEDYFGFDFDGVLRMTEDEKDERLAAFKEAGWKYFNEQPVAVMPEPVINSVTEIDGLRHVVYFVGDGFDAEGNVTRMLLCNEAVEDEANLNFVFIETPNGETSLIKCVVPVF